MILKIWFFPCFMANNDVSICCLAAGTAHISLLCFIWNSEQFHSSQILKPPFRAQLSHRALKKKIKKKKNRAVFAPVGKCWNCSWELESLRAEVSKNLKGFFPTQKMLRSGFGAAQVSSPGEGRAGTSHCNVENPKKSQINKREVVAVGFFTSSNQEILEIQIHSAFFFFFFFPSPAPLLLC